MARASRATSIASRRRASRSASSAADLLIAIADALTAVHRAGIAHRDVKPANVMLAPGGRVVLMDFGLFLPEFEVAAQATIAGSPQYMAPEAIDTVEPGAGGLVDLYALGVMAYEMLAGVPPFHGETPDEVWDRHLYDPIPDLAQARPDVPASLASARARSAREGSEPAPAEPGRRGVAAPVGARAAKATAREEPYSVLIVDDDRDTAKVIGFYVRKVAPDVDVRVVSSGEAAIDAVRQREPNVILLDLHMPRMNGIEVCTFLAAQASPRARRSWSSAQARRRTICSSCRSWGLRSSS